MANVFVPSANDPAVFTTDKFPLLKDGDGNTYRTVVKANVNGSFDVYSKGTGLFGGDELLFQSNTNNQINFRDGKFKDKPSTAFNSFFKSTNSNGEQFVKDVKTKWYSEAPPNAAARMATLRGYQSIAATTPARQTSTGPQSLTIQTGAGTTTIVSPPAAPVDPSSGGVQQTTIGEDDFNLTQITTEIKPPSWNGKVYRYPTKIQDNNQDYIKFSVYDYKVRRPSAENPLVQEQNRNLGESIATLVLPIQPSITDTNTVDWNGLGLNPVELAGYGLATAGMTGNANDFTGILEKLGTTVTQDSNVQKAITLYLKQKAIGVNGLLSRFGGAVVNPNTELLFQGPQLRPFNFTFRLSPRDEPEANQVKNIIRVFKESMAVKIASDGLFLAAPNIFKISYINGTTKDENGHKSLNKIKTCALQSCSVDYTPDGSYMTFNDREHTMTSYNLTLQFQELEPVTNRDYQQLSANEIGY